MVSFRKATASKKFCDLRFTLL